MLNGLMNEWKEEDWFMILNIDNGSDCLKIESKHFSLSFLSEWINNYYVIFVCKYSARLSLRVFLFLKPVFFFLNNKFGEMHHWYLFKNVF